MTNAASASNAPVSRRRSGPPFIEGAIANPIGRKRGLASSPVPAASAGRPPGLKRVSDANWAVPDQPTADITTDGSAPSIGAASSPKLIPTAATGSAIGTEARRPSGHALGVHLTIRLRSRPATRGVRRVRWQGHAWCAAGSASADRRQQHLYPEAVPAIGLEDFKTGVVVEFLPGKGISAVPADVGIPDAPSARITVGALPYLCSGPRSTRG